MVVWEITLATAYFLGLKRTYKLALKIQRRLISAKHPKIRQFVQRRTRIVFDVALRVHRNIQERDIQAGRNVANWILRWLDKKKPSANIRGTPHELPPVNHNHNHGTSITKQNNYHQKNDGNNTTTKGSDRHMFSVTTPKWSTSFPSITMVVRHPRPVGTQYRQLWLSGYTQLLAPRIGSLGSGGVIRDDIKLWMQQH
ncbi:hypothetical protein SOVF_075780 [Spinacia oleracea]|uniref:Uncharacterized protein n=1 Tax=Spinacia oleracea TaxID=3562 RepID=A0A9R0IMH9_SPIOL|nr:uncharacterized protein LOC110791639 [Spinacia oleracea]KNA17885.1 hypothetical protein SOVF_075780 [Spinacia oleracea]